MPLTHPSPQRSNHTRPPPHTAPDSRVYLSPIQEQRILSWRDHAQSSAPSPKTKVKSAPASLSLSKDTSSSTCTCGGKSSCCCSTKTPPSKSSQQKTYYSRRKKKKHSTSAMKNPAPPLTNTAPQLTPVTPTTSISPAMHTTRARPDKRGLPSAEQMIAYRAGAGLPPQYGQAPTVPLPEPALAAPPVKPDVTRIAGVRDPVSQN